MQVSKSITKRIYIWTCITIGILTIVFTVLNGIDSIKGKRLEYEKDLCAITGLLGNHLNQSFDDILASKGGLDKSEEQQVLILNSVLQPIVDDIWKEYPKLGMGYYSIRLDHSVAVEPNFGPDKLVPIPHNRPFFQVYDTGKPVLITVDRSVEWGVPILTYTSPIFDSNGKIIGHTSANVNLNSIYESLLARVAETIAIGLAGLALVLSILIIIFDRLSKEINVLAEAIVTEGQDVDEEILPELQPVLDKIRNHISEIKNMQIAVNNSDERFCKAFNNSPHMMSISRRSDCRYIDANQRFLTHRGFSREDIIGKTPTDVGVLESELQTILNLIDQKGIVENLEVAMATKDGLKGTILLSVDKIILDNEECMLFAYNDISDIKSMQAEMARLDRLNLVGQMAAGIGHEIRNPMTTVRGYLQLLGARPANAELKPTFDLLIDELDRANSIITEFLSLAKTSQSELQIQNLNDILKIMYPLIEADAFMQNKQIQFIPGQIPNLPLNAKEINQLVLNLCRNGLEAIQDQGCLTIQTYADNNNVLLTVADEGCGIPEENLHKLGTPFFTTKGDGTGLGLSICYRIAHNHNAIIDVRSSPTGTTFILRFVIPNEEGR